jgi:hypothetical protein
MRLISWGCYCCIQTYGTSIISQRNTENLDPFFKSEIVNGLFCSQQKKSLILGQISTLLFRDLRPNFASCVQLCFFVCLKFWFQISAWGRLVQTEFCHAIPQSFRGNAGIVIHIRAWPLSSYCDVPPESRNVWIGAAVHCWTTATIRAEYASLSGWQLNAFTRQRTHRQTFPAQRRCPFRYNG